MHTCTTYNHILESTYRSLLKKYAPLQWSDYFDKEDDVKVPGSDNVTNLYDVMYH